MGFLAQLVAPAGERRQLQGPLPLTASTIVEWLNGPATSTGLRVGPESALKIGPAYACINVISQDVAKLPFILYRREQRGKSRATDHPLYPRLHDAPNPMMTALHFRQTLQAHLLGWGNAFANVERGDTGKVLALWPLHPGRMQRPVLAADGRLLYTYSLPNGEPRALTQDEVFHLRGLASDGVWGYSPISLHREALALTQATQEYGARFFANDARPGGYLQSKTRLSKEAQIRLKENWETAHRGLDVSHRMAVLEEGIEFKEVGIAPEDAQFLATRTFQVEEIARIFRVPPHKIAELSRATYSNIEEQAIEYVTDTLGYWLVNWEQQVMLSLLTEPEHRVYFAEHLLDALLRGKTLERWQAYQMAIQNGVYTPNDVLEKENGNAYDGGDVHLQPLNLGPIGTLPQAQRPVGAASPSNGS